MPIVHVSSRILQIGYSFSCKPLLKNLRIINGMSKNGRGKKIETHKFILEGAFRESQ